MKNNNWLYKAYKTNELPVLKSAHKRFKKPEVYYDLYSLPANIVDYGKNKKYYIRTYGCQANERDSEHIMGILEDIGYTRTMQAESADFLLLNTCAVRENAEKKVFGEIGLLKKIKYKTPDVLFALSGCMTQEPAVINKILKKIPYIDIVFGTHNIYRLPQLLEEALFTTKSVIEVWSKEGHVIENLPSSRESHIKAWVDIMYGCNYFCTYCIIPYTRGKERSRPVKVIVEEIKGLVESGYKEICLLGQNVNSYGKDLKEDVDFTELLKLVADTGIKRIRFTTSNPWNFPIKLMETIAQYPNIMPHVHLPMQSGSSSVLKRMSRRNTRETYLEITENLKKIIPNISLTTDIIVGFPNETNEEFQGTLDIYDIIQFDNAYTFIYSQREGTPAASMSDNVAMEEKYKRLYALNDKVTTYSKKNKQKLIGREVEVLVDGQSKNDHNFLSGHDANNNVVNFIGEKNDIGEIIKLRITKALNFSLMAEKCN